MVDNVITTVDSALAKAGQTSKAVERWKAEMPKEEEMVARDKYTVFDRKAKRYRKGIHSMWGSYLMGEGGFGLEHVRLTDCSEQRCRSGPGSARESIHRAFRESIPYSIEVAIAKYLC